MTLEMDTETVNFVDWRAFEAFVNGIYGGEFDFVSTEECGNDSDHTYDVTGNLGTHEWDKEGIEKIRKGDYPMFCTSTLLDVLCADGHIPPATYIIQVSW